MKKHILFIFLTIIFIPHIAFGVASGGSCSPNKNSGICNEGLWCSNQVCTKCTLPEISGDVDSELLESNDNIYTIIFNGQPKPNYYQGADKCPFYVKCEENEGLLTYNGAFSCQPCQAGYHNNNTFYFGRYIFTKWESSSKYNGYYYFCRRNSNDGVATKDLASCSSTTLVPDFEAAEQDPSLYCDNNEYNISLIYQGDTFPNGIEFTPRTFNGFKYTYETEWDDDQLGYVLANQIVIDIDDLKNNDDFIAFLDEIKGRFKIKIVVDDGDNNDKNDVVLVTIFTSNRKSSEIKDDINVNTVTLNTDNHVNTIKAWIDKHPNGNADVRLKIKLDPNGLGAHVLRPGKPVPFVADPADPGYFAGNMQPFEFSDKITISSENLGNANACAGGTTLQGAESFNIYYCISVVNTIGTKGYLYCDQNVKFKQTSNIIAPSEGYNYQNTELCETYVEQTTGTGDNSIGLANFGDILECRMVLLVEPLARDCREGYYCTLCTETPCDNGEFQNEAKKYSCKQCEMGTYTPNDDRPHTSCEPCPAGTYQDEKGKSSCISCQDGTTTTTDATTGIFTSDENTGQSSRELCYINPDIKLTDEFNPVGDTIQDIKNSKQKIFWYGDKDN